MPKLELFVAPNTCARVPTIALEEIGVPFTTHLLRLARNQQYDNDYLRLNPKGKVPTLLINGAPLTENASILNWLAASYPDAELMPMATDALESARCLSDLIHFASTVHPAVTRVAMPMRFFPDTAAALEKGRPMAIEALGQEFASIEARLSSGPWWYGEKWSLVDGYLLWAWSRVAMIGFPQEKFPNIARHTHLSLSRPAIQRAIERERRDIETLKAENLYNQPS